MRTTIDLPDELFKAVKLEAVHRGTTLKNYISAILRDRLDAQSSLPVRLPLRAQTFRGYYTDADRARIRREALARMEKGYPLGGKPLTREEIYDRQAVR